MRRGRPPATSNPGPQPPRQNPSPAKVTNGDPFAALDSKFAIQGGDELSSRFPTLDQFAILHDHGAKFEFDSTIPPASEAAQPAQKDLSQRLSERLVDDAFQIRPVASPAPPPASQRQPAESSKPDAYSNPPEPRVSPPLKSSSAPPRQPEISRASAIISSTPELKAISSQASQASYKPPSERPMMVSTGTMTTPPPERQTPPAYQIYRFPPNEQNQTSSLPRKQDTGNMTARVDALGSSQSGAVGSRTPSLQAQPRPTHIRHPSSSRPSLEGGRPSLDQLEPTSRPRQQSNSRPRPVSTHLDSNIDYLRDREGYSKPLISQGHPSPRYSVDKDLPPPPGPEDETSIESNVEFLRSMEESEPRKKEWGPKHMKRSSLSSLGSGTKNILAGKFGDAFKRFEGNSGGQAPPRTPSPLKDLERRDLTPIEGSEATDGRSDNGDVRDIDDMTPEMRREQEARMLAQEEARVAAAQAEYRQRVAQRGQGGPANTGPTPLPKSIGGVSRAVSIQNKVQSLLDESNRSSSTVVRTAQGYGPYSDAARPASSAGGEGRPAVPRKPAPTGNMARGSSIDLVSGGGSSVQPSSTGRTAVSSTGTGRPMAPPKPGYLNKTPTSSAGSLPVGGRAGSPPKPSVPSSSVGRLRSTTDREQRDATLVAVELPGQPVLQMTAAEKDDYIRDFQKRFPSLTSIEMVERDLAAEAEGEAVGAGRGRGR